MTTTKMQGLDDYLRAQASVIGMQGMHSAAETLRQWASEVEAAAQAPVVPIVDKAFDEQTLWAGYVSQNHFGATGEGGLFHFKRGAGFARRMLSTPASETAPSVQPEPLTPKAFAELCDLAREINNRPNSNCPVKCESMAQCSGACDFLEPGQDEPVARVGIGPFALTKPWFEMIEGKTLPDGVHDLYTRPASGDAVRQAAQAVIDAFDMAPGPRKVLRTNRCLIDLRLALLSLDAPKDAAVGAWRPIEEAPTDGTRILLGVFPTRGMASGQTEIDYYHLATWDGEHSHPYVPNNWTHFQYLPPPPGSGEGEGT